MTEEARTIRVTYEIPHPPAKVWRALTEPSLVASWLMENDIRPVVGHEFTFRTSPMPGWDGVVRCRVLEAEAPKRLSYSWRGGAPESLLDSVVTWTLTASPSGGTELTLEHSGFLPRNAFAFEAMGKGWRGKVGERLSDVCARLA